MASLINAVLTDAALEEEILAAQDAALARLRARDFAGTLLGFVDRVRTAPRLPPCRVAPDFWRQLERLERLEALRGFRPSAFRALPEPAEDLPEPLHGAPPDATA